MTEQPEMFEEEMEDVVEERPATLLGMLSDLLDSRDEEDYECDFDGIPVTEDEFDELSEAESAMDEAAVWLEIYEEFTAEEE